MLVVVNAWILTVIAALAGWGYLIFGWLFAPLPLLAVGVPLMVDRSSSLVPWCRARPATTRAVDAMIRQGHHIGTAAVLLTLSVGVAHADPVTAKAPIVTRPQVDRTCNNAQNFAEANPNRGATFWDVTAGLIPPAGGGLWWRIDSIERWAVTDALGAHGPNTQVTVWRTPDNVMLVAAFFTSDSGDWAHFVDYCYRPDGTLARTTSTFNSFVAANLPDGIHRERTRYLDAKGKVVGSRSTVSNLATGKRLQIRSDGNDEPAYFTVEKWPFYALLRSLLGS